MNVHQSSIIYQDGRLRNLVSLFTSHSENVAVGDGLPIVIGTRLGKFLRKKVSAGINRKHVRLQHLDEGKENTDEDLALPTHFCVNEEFHFIGIKDRVCSRILA